MFEFSTTKVYMEIGSAVFDLAPLGFVLRSMVSEIGTTKIHISGTLVSEFGT